MGHFLVALISSIIIALVLLEYFGTAILAINVISEKKQRLKKEADESELVIYRNGGEQ
jgi:hypothetical protein